jgi:hypothetical protein
VLWSSNSLNIRNRPNWFGIQSWHSCMVFAFDRLSGDCSSRPRTLRARPSTIL